MTPCHAAVMLMKKVKSCACKTHPAIGKRKKETVCVCMYVFEDKYES